METKALVLPRWDDVVFENRNKEYGAYVIRKTYPTKVLIGLFGTICIVTLLLVVPRIAAMFGKDIPKIIEINLTDDGIILQPPPIFETVPPPPPQAMTFQAQTTNANLPPIVTHEEVIETPPPVESGPVGEGGETGGPVVSSGTAIGTGIVEPPVVEVRPEFMLNPGTPPVYENGIEGMMQFITRKLRYPSSARRMGIEGTVYVSFIVNGDGSVGKVEVLRGFHPDCDKEAVRVISMMPGWKGGMHGGVPVPVKMVLPIKFDLRD